MHKVAMRKLPSTNPGSYSSYNAPTNAAYGNSVPIGSPERGAMYVACRAEVASNNTAYFSPIFAASSVNVVRKEFRKVVTTQYGPVSKLQCTGKFSGTMVNEQVEKWKDSARTTNNAIIDLFGSTGEEAAKAPQHQSSQSVRYEQPAATFRAKTAAAPGQSNFQR
jgi:hypothetical protein